MTSKLRLAPLLVCAIALEAWGQTPVTVHETLFNRENQNGSIEQVEQVGTSCQKKPGPITTVCHIGKLCVTGCADPGTSVGLSIEGRLVKTTTADASGGWVAEINLERLDGGRVLEAAAVGPGKVLLDETSWDSRWSFTVEGGLTFKQRPSPGGGSRVGMFVGVMPTLYPVSGAHWFGVALRYTGAQVSDEALHRLGLALDFDLAEGIWMARTPAPRPAYDGVSVTVSINFGGAFFTQNSNAGGSAIVAGPTAGGALRVVFPVARPVYLGLRLGVEAFIQGEESFPMIDGGLTALVAF